MKILVIGSKGFIGSYCVKHFSAKNEVWECDVVTDYNTPNYFLVDGTNADYSDIFQNQRFDVCINCSGWAVVSDSLTNPKRDFMLNTVNVFKMLDSIRKYNLDCKFVNLSSAAVYGNPEKLPVTEDQKLSPMSPYGLHKKMAEEICAEFYHFYNIPTISVRVFSAYGNGLKKQLFWDLYQKIIHSDSKKIELFGTGNESRDFIHISDLLLQLDLIISNSRFDGGAINVANGEQIKISKIAEIFAKEAGWKAEVCFLGNERAGDPKNWEADIHLVKKFGYKQTVGIEEGIKRYIKWVRESV